MRPALKEAYSYPEYCDIAYNWDRKPECDFIERCIVEYSDAKTRSILDIACGTGIHLREFARRGFEAAGIDAKKEMVDFVLKKAAAEGLSLKCLRSDMKIFDLGRKFGCAICMLDSFRYLLTDEEIFSHLESAAASLEKGGIYIIDLWMPKGDRIGVWEDVSWAGENGDILIDARYVQHGGTFNAGDGTFEDEVIFNVTSPSFNSIIVSRMKTKVFIFDEFRKLLDKQGIFELKERFYNFDFKFKGGYNVKLLGQVAASGIRTNLVLKKRR